MSDVRQSYANHRRFVPAFHMVAFPILVLWLLWSAWLVATDLTLDHAMRLLLAVALLILFFCMRIFAMTVQDRVIRLEMRLRLEKVLPGDLRARIGELTLDQLVALRFASDAEMPALVRAVLDEGIADRDTIKRRVKDWQADDLRC